MRARIRAHTLRAVVKGGNLISQVGHPANFTGVMPSPTIVYVAGSGRSGSTLLERTVGALPGFVNVGELLDLFRRVLLRDERCGCGEPMSHCAFWAAVGHQAFGGWGQKTISEIANLQAKVARQRRIPQLLLRSPDHRFAEEARRYRDFYARLYRTILSVAGAQYVVDASKWPSQALALSGGPIDVRVIHLVRDVRGVAYSMQKTAVRRPQAVRAGEHMKTWRPTRSAINWTITQSETDLLRLRVPVVRVQYEDFIRHPRETLSTTLASLGLPSPSEADMAHVRQGSINLSPSHGLSGNPSRFRHGQGPLELDESWRTGLTRSHRFVTAAIGLPQTVATRRMAVKPHRIFPDGHAERPGELQSMANGRGLA